MHLQEGILLAVVCMCTASAQIMSPYQQAFLPQQGMGFGGLGQPALTNPQFGGAAQILPALGGTGQAQQIPSIFGGNIYSNLGLARSLDANGQPVAGQQPIQAGMQQADASALQGRSLDGGLGQQPQYFVPQANQYGAVGQGYPFVQG